MCIERTWSTPGASPRHVTSTTGTERLQDRAGSLRGQSSTKIIASTNCNRSTTAVVPCEECPKDYSTRDALPQIVQRSGKALRGIQDHAQRMSQAFYIGVGGSKNNWLTPAYFPSSKACTITPTRLFSSFVSRSGGSNLDDTLQH